MMMRSRLFTFFMQPTRLMFVEVAALFCSLSGCDSRSSLPPTKTVLDAKTLNIPDVFHCSM